jgi:branched-chain amino acid transport system substrate-binding protein
MSLTGRFANFGKLVHQGYLLWTKHVNAKGGLLGRPVELLIYDDQSDPQTSVNLYQQLISQDKVDLVLGPFSSSIAIVASTVTEKLRYPMIPIAPAEEIWNRDYRYIFGLSPPAMHLLDGALALAKQKGLKRIALINENNVTLHSVARGVIEGARELELEIIFHEEWKKGTQDFLRLLQEIKALEPEVLLTAGLFEQDLLITRQLKELDFMPKLYASASAAHLDEFGAILGPDAEYIFGGSGWEPYPRLMKKRFIQPEIIDSIFVPFDGLLMQRLLFSWLEPIDPASAYTSPARVG